MPLLVGRTDTGAFTATAWSGFGDGNAATTTYTAAASGTADTLDVYIESFGANSRVDVAIYEQTAGAGDFNLVTTVQVPSAAAPQQVTGLSIPITATNVYRTLFIGDNTALDANAGNGFQIYSDPLIVSPEGVGSFVVEATPPATMNTVGREADGEYMWGLTGPLAGPTENLGVRVDVVDTSNNPVANADYLVWVEDTTGTTLVAQQTIASVSGTIEIDDQALGAIDDVVYVAIRLVAESDPDMAAVMVPATVFDLDA